MKNAIKRVQSQACLIVPYRLGRSEKNSDRVACIRYIRENGDDAFAEKMAKEKQMTMKRNR
jgi:hypothetical protein